MELGEIVNINGVDYNESDITTRTLHLIGIDPTDHEQWQHVNLIAIHKLVKENARGSAQKIYRYSDLSDLPKFYDFELPYLIKVTTTTETKKDGTSVDVILSADFTSIREIKQELKTKTNTNTQTPNKPKT